MFCSTHSLIVVFYLVLLNESHDEIVGLILVTGTSNPNAYFFCTKSMGQVSLIANFRY